MNSILRVNQNELWENVFNKWTGPYLSGLIRSLNAYVPGHRAIFARSSHDGDPPDKHLVGIAAVLFSDFFSLSVKRCKIAD